MLVASNLKTELENLTPTDSEPAAVATLADAWTSYFYGASVAGTPCAAGSLDPAKAAMVSSLTGMSVSGQGPGKLQDGLVAFWSQVASLGATVWPGTIAPFTPPPGLSGVAAALLVAFSANQEGNKTLSEAAQAVSDLLHSGAGLGGVATMPGSPPVPTPIL